MRFCVVLSVQLFFSLLFSSPAIAQDAPMPFRNWKIGKSQGGDKLALVIGNSAYQYNGSLSEPEKDARAISKALFSQGVDVSESYNLRRDQMDRVIHEFATKLRGYDTGIIFYAGHGFQVDGKNYLVPVDADPAGKSDVAIECIDLEMILNKINDGSKPKVIILDACRNNPFEGNWEGAEYRGSSSGFAKVDVTTNTRLIYSTAADTRVLDRNPFTEELAKEIKNGGCLDDIFRNVLNSIDLINAREGTTQQPWNGDNLRKEICFGEMMEGGSAFRNTRRGVKENEPSPDQDGDGIADHLDDCISTKGLVENRGCPILDLTTWLGKVEKLKAMNHPLEPEFKRLQNINLPETDERLAYLYFDQALSGVNYEVGLALLRKSAMSGAGLAAYQLGLLYGEGKLVPRSSGQYLHWLKVAAGKKNSWVQRRVSRELHAGEVVPPDPAQAFNLMLEAARTGYPPAQNDLGDFYRKGTGTEADANSSVIWYTLAAEQGWAEAQFNLGMCYLAGTGLVKDPTEGKQWLRAAAKQGHPGAKKALSKQ